MLLLCGIWCTHAGMRPQLDFSDVIMMTGLLRMQLICMLCSLLAGLVEREPAWKRAHSAAFLCKAAHHGAC